MKEHNHSHDLNVKKVDRLSATRVKLTVEFTADTVKEHEKSTVQRYQAQARIPGFRVGKAPANMVRTRYKEEIVKDVVSHLMEAGLHEALQKTKLSPINRPQFSLGATDVALDKPFEFHAEFEVQPEIDLKDYQNIKVAKVASDVSEKELSDAVDDLRDRFASLDPSDAKKAEKNLFAIAEIGWALADGSKKEEAAKPMTIELGKESILPEIENALLEMSVGDEKSVTSRFQEDHSDKAVAGKEAIFQIKLLELKQKKLPDLTDEWAGQLREGSTVEKLKEEMKDSLSKRKSEDGLRRQKDELLSHLVKMNPFDVSPALVERQAYRLIESILEDYKRQGVVNPPAFKDEQVKSIRSRAEQMVRGSLLLKEVAQKENIVADPARVEKKIDEIAGSLNRPTDEVKKLLAGRGMLQQIEDEALTDQVFDFLLAQAKQG